MAMDTFKDKAEKSSVRLSHVHADKIQSLAESATDIRKALPDRKGMKVDFNSSSLHTSKTLITVRNMNYAYQSDELWPLPLDLVKKGLFIIQNGLSVLEQLSFFNNKLYDHELKTILNRFLFPISSWDKKCSCLSGGEKMKLSLCCLMVSAQTPDLFIVDEPTNNIDIMNMEILTDTLKEYRGTLLVVSHDACFVQQINIEKTITLSCS